MDLANTLYMRMVDHRLRQREADLAQERADRTEAYQLADKYQDQTMAIDQQAFDRNIKLAQAMGQAEVMSGKDGQSLYKDPMMEQYAELGRQQGRSGWRKKMAEMKAEAGYAQQLQGIKDTASMRRTQYPHSKEAQATDDLSRWYNYRLPELQWQLKHGMDETGQPVASETQKALGSLVNNLYKNFSRGRETAGQVMLDYGVLLDRSGRNHTAALSALAEKYPELGPALQSHGLFKSILGLEKGGGAGVPPIQPGESLNAYSARVNPEGQYSPEQVRAMYMQAAGY